MKYLLILMLTIFFIACDKDDTEEKRGTVGELCYKEGTCNTGLTCVTEDNGKFCREVVKDCSSNPCKNGATCTDGDETYSCECVLGYEGKNCSINIDDCSPNPCPNDVKCTDGINSYECETEKILCSSNPCKNGATCTDGDETYSCECLAGFSGTNCENDTTSFITTWKTDNEGESNYNQLTIPTSTLGTYDYNIDCDNDGVFEAEGQTGDYTCTYDGAGTYTVRITGIFSRIYFNYLGDAKKIISIDQWGNQEWNSMENAFAGCSNLAGQAVDAPNLSKVTDMTGMFADAILFNQDISDWDTSNVTRMFTVFQGATSFNQNIGNWDTSNVTQMGGLFQGAISFNQDIGNWDVGMVHDMYLMFSKAESFNQNIGNWDTSNVTSMGSMFDRASSFNQDLSGWNVDKVEGCFGFDSQASSWILPKPNFENCYP